jgi:hypothetical protein
MRLRYACVWGLVALAVVVRCGGNAGTTCVAGTTSPCNATCGTGIQTCSSDGSGFGACVCPSPNDAGGDVSVSDAQGDVVVSDASGDVEAGPWTPSQLSGLRLWLDAEVGVNASVFSWADQSGNGNNATQTNPQSQPQVVPNVVNGRSVVRSQSGVLTIKDAASLQFSTQPFEIVVIGSGGSGSASCTFWEKNTLNAGLWWNMTTAGGSGQDIYVGTGTPTAHLTFLNVDGSNHHFEVDAPSLAVTVDGTTVTGPTATCDMSVVGTDVGLGDCSGGRIDLAEVIVIAGALSMSDATNLNQYLLAKFNL